MDSITDRGETIALINGRCKMSQPDISVAMMTYYHEKYVAQAIDSVLSQKTKYTYEIVISDDGSTDKTREILKSYKDKYPDIIVLNFNETNIGISANHYKTRSLCKGKYIADIAGDDYWIDDEKLQKQADFLENNQEYVATVTCVEVRPEESDKKVDLLPARKYRGKDVNLDMYLKGIPLSTHGLMVRNYYLTEEGREYFSLIPKASKYIDDSTECLLMLQKGKVKVMDFPSCVYRVQITKSNKHNYNSINTVMSHAKKMIALYNYLQNYLSLDFCNLYRINYARASLYCFLKGKIGELTELKNDVPQQYRENIAIKALPFAIQLGVESLVRKIKRKINLKKG